MAVRDIIIALDLGTTGNRAIAFAHDGRTVSQSYYEFTQHFPAAGHVEHDPDELFDAALRALTDVITEVGAGRIAAMGITNQRETTVIWDRKTGDPIHNAIVWQDRRTQGICKKLAHHADAVKATTGLFMDPYFSGSKIKWLLDNIEGARDRAEAGDLAFGTPDTYVLWRLTGGRIHATEPSNASRTLLLNLQTLDFDEAMLDIFDVPRSLLPEIRDSDANFGTTSRNVVGAEIPITGILGDQQASLFGQCGWDTDVVKATYGTGIFLLASTGELIRNFDKLLTTVAWKTRERVSYALEGSLFMGGASIQWLRDNLGLLKNAAESEEKALAVPDNDGVYFVPAFQGLGAPYWNAGARGTLIGLTRRTTSDTIVRAVLESLAYQVRDVIDEMKREAACDYSVLRVDGGASMNGFIMQFQSDLLQLPVERPEITETTALGAAGISGISSGFWTFDSFADIRRVSRVFEPDMSREKADGYYCQWQEAVKRSMDWA